MRHKLNVGDLTIRRIGGLAVVSLLAWGLPVASLARAPARIPGPIDAAAVLDAVYDQRKDGTWESVVPADAPPEAGQDLRGHKVEVRPLMSAHFLQHGSERFLVITALIDPQNTCHGCSVLIGAALYVRDAGDTSWHPGPVAAALDLAGSFGSPPEVSFEQLGPDSYGFGVRDKYHGTGETDDWLTLWRAAPKQFSKLLRVHLLLTEEQMSQPPASDCEVARNDVRVLSGSRSGVFDLALHISKGTLHTSGDAVDACELPLPRAADFKQMETVFHYDPATNRYCQAATFPGAEPQAPRCRH